MPKAVRVVLCALFLAALVPTAAFAADRVPPNPKPGSDSFGFGRASGLPGSLAAAVTTAAPDEWEDADDGYANATDMTWLTEELVQDHTLDTVNDKDYFVMSCYGNTLMDVETITDVDTMVEIRDFYTHELLNWWDDKSSSDLGSRGFYENRDGVGRQVYVIVSAANSRNGVGAYRLVVTPKPDMFMPGVTTRVAGANRFAVAVNTGKAMYWPKWTANGAPVTDVIVVNGEDRAMADPLAASSLAGWYHAPILTVTSARLPSETATAIKEIRNGNGGKVRIHVLGGTGSINGAVYGALGKLRGTGGSIERISGATRYELAAKIADRVDQLWMTNRKIHAPVAVIANGENPAAFADALAASAICFRMGWPMVLTQNTKVPAPTSSRLNGVFKDSDTVIVNSPAYVPTSVFKAVSHTETSRMSQHADRYNSSVDIAMWGMEHRILSAYEVVFVNKLSDALAAGTYTGWYGGVLLYTTLDGPYSTPSIFLKARSSMIEYGTLFGGTSSISPGTFNRVRTLLNPNL